MKKFVTLLVTLLVVASMTFCAVAEEKPFAGQTLTVSTFSRTDAEEHLSAVYGADGRDCRD